MAHSFVFILLAATTISVVSAYIPANLTEALPVVVVKNWQRPSTFVYNEVITQFLKDEERLLASERTTINVRGETVSFDNITYVHFQKHKAPLVVSIIDFDSFHDLQRSVASGMLAIQGVLFALSPFDYLTPAIYDAAVISYNTGIGKPTIILTDAMIATHRERYSAQRRSEHFMSTFWDNATFIPVHEIQIDQALSDKRQRYHLKQILYEVGVLQNDDKNFPNFKVNVTKQARVLESYYISNLCYLYKNIHQSDRVNVALLHDKPGSNHNKTEDAVFVQSGKIMTPKMLYKRDASLISVMLDKKQPMSLYKTIELRDINTNAKIAGCIVARMG